MKILAFSTSPRIGGNSETMLEQAISGISGNGGYVEKIRTHDLKIAPCTGCGCCEKKIKCIINDDFQNIYDKIILYDGFIFSVPLYFMNIPGAGKSLIDRFQCFWVARKITGIDLFDGRKRPGLLLSCSGAEFGPEASNPFRGLLDTMTYVFDSIGIKKFDSVLARKIEKKYEVIKHPEIIKKSFDAGSEMVEKFSH